MKARIKYAKRACGHTVRVMKWGRDATPAGTFCFDCRSAASKLRMATWDKVEKKVDAPR